MMDSWHSYPKVYALGHAATKELLARPVLVEEKIDGSLFSFGVDEGGELHVRSKGKEMHPDAPEALFREAVATAKELAPALHPGWTYRSEYLRVPKHNTLKYARTPHRHLIIFDINTGQESYLAWAEKHDEAERIGLECVQTFLDTAGPVTLAELQAFLTAESALGGVPIEGVVIKPHGYDLFGLDKKVVMGKLVREEFKEAHAREWKVSNPQQGDIIATLGERLMTEARWRKAVQHLRERGLLECSPRDIGALLKEVPNDTEAEEADRIKDALYHWAWPQIRRLITRGLPEWYKAELLKDISNVTT